MGFWNNLDAREDDLTTSIYRTILFVRETWKQSFNFSEDIDIDHETGQKLESDRLPSDLEEYVHRDNVRYQEEIEEWDTEQKRKALQKATGSDDVVVVGEVKASR